MVSRYVYSLNGEDYVGAYNTRASAEAAALSAVHFMAEPPSTVFTARSVIPDPNVAGCARLLISQVVARDRTAGEGGYLANVSEEELGDLDADLEKTLVGWLARHQRIPTASRVEAINEIPVPPEPENHVLTVSDEVYDLGVSDAADVSPH
jgi:hypothetical protein